VEHVIAGHSAVEDCAVIGVPDEKWGDAVKAVVQLKTGARGSEAEIKSVQFVESLPRSPNGKVLGDGGGRGRATPRGAAPALLIVSTPWAMVTTTRCTESRAGMMV
jgi:AMP-binding enzyme C-terminal domain